MSSHIKKRSSFHILVIRGKEMLFFYYWLVVVSGCGLAVVLSSQFKISEQSTVTIVGGLMAFCYFIQKQKLDEATFFRQLFSDFNARYDKLNDDLSIVLEHKAIGANKKQLIDYFNLCSEEYLMFERGYIPLNVWNSWLSGMYQYWSIKEVQNLWIEEIGTGSYYEFNPADHFEQVGLNRVNCPKKEAA